MDPQSVVCQPAQTKIVACIAVKLFPKRAWLVHREAAASSSSKGRKKTPEELSVEVLLHFAGTVRAFYASVAKAVHAQARRRDDPASQPNAAMKAASVTLGVIMKTNLGPRGQVIPAALFPCWSVMVSLPECDACLMFSMVFA